MYSRESVGLLLGCIGIIGAAIVNKNNKVAGGLMLLSAIGGLLALGLFWGYIVHTAISWWFIGIQR